MHMPSKFYDLGEMPYFRFVVFTLICARDGGDAELRRVVRDWLVHELHAADAADALDELGIDPAYAKLLRDADARVLAEDAAKRARTHEASTEA